MKKRKFKSERYIGLDESDECPSRVDRSPPCLTSLESLESLKSDDFTTHTSYFLLNAAHVAMKEQTVKTRDTWSELLMILKEKFCSSPDDKSTIYAPTIGKTLDVLSLVISDGQVAAMEEADLVESILAKTLAHVKTLTPSSATALSTTHCRLIDRDMAEQLAASAVRLVHRLLNALLLEGHNARSCRVGMMALDAIGGTDRLKLHTIIALLSNNDKSMVAFFLERHEIVLRLALLQGDEQLAALLTAFTAQLTPVAAFVLLLDQCVFDEVLWIDLLVGKETRALEYLLRVTKLMLDCDAQQLAIACDCVHGILSSVSTNSTASDLHADGAATGGGPLTAVWEQPRDLPKPTFIPPQHWHHRQTSTSHHSATPTGPELCRMTSSFLSRLGVRLVASRACLSFEPQLLIARLEKIVPSIV